MISTNDIQRAYNDLYVELRKYIWGFEVVKAIADLEVASYTAFPDMAELKSVLSKLKMLIRYDMDDEELKESFDKFEELIKDDPEIYLKLNEIEGAE